jgi:hypothetical protein
LWRTGFDVWIRAYGDLLPASVDTYGGQDLTAIELAYHERAQKKLAVETVVNAPLVMRPSSSQAPSVDGSRSGSGSGSEVVVPQPEPEPEPELVDVAGQNVEDEHEERFEDAKSQKADDDEGEAGPGPRDARLVKDDAPPSNPDLTASFVLPRGMRPGPVHEGWRCEGCGVRMTVVWLEVCSHCTGRSDIWTEVSLFEVRLVRGSCADADTGSSANCSDYNLCSSCMAKNVHDPTHRMLCIRDPADASKLRDEVAEGEDNSITLGLRVYTKGPAAATVAGQLRHGKVVAWDRKN